MAIVYEGKYGNATVKIDDTYCAGLTPDSPEVKEILRRCAEIYINSLIERSIAEKKKKESGEIKT